MFKKSSLILGAVFGVVLALPAAAQEVTKHKEDKHVIPTSDHTVTGNVGLYSEYIFRGLAQTNGDPAIQGGLDYAHSSGFYLGAWGSNVSVLRENISAGTAPLVVGGSYSQGGSLELDLYGGYKSSFGSSDFTYDVGLLQYWYPGTVTTPGTSTSPAAPYYNIKANTTEAYAALGWKWLSVKYSQSLGDTFGVDNASGTYYLDLAATIPLAESGVTLGLHYGIQKYKGTDRRLALGGYRAGTTNDNVYSYNDYRVSLAYDLGKTSKTLTGMETGIMFTGTSSADNCGYGSTAQACARGAGLTGAYPKNIANNRTTIWLKKSF